MVVLATEARKSERRRRNLTRQSGPVPGKKTPEADRALIVDLTGSFR